MISGKELEALFRKYLLGHSTRRLNYMFWNVVDLKETTIQLVNLSGKELIRANNPDLIYRAVKIKNSEDWEALKGFFETYVIDPDFVKVIHVIRLDYLASYLKSVKFDVSKINFTRTGYGTVMTVEDKPKPIATIDPDILSIYLLDNLHTTYRRALYGNEDTWKVDTITQEYLDADDFHLKIGDEVRLPVVENLDVISKKYLRELLAQEPKTKLEQIHAKSGITTISTRLTTPGMSIVNVRAYLLCYPKKKSKG